MDQAVDRALGVSYPIKEQDQIVKRSRFSYISTIDPYLPRIDVEMTYTRYLDAGARANVVGSSAYASAARGIYSFLGVVSYRLFDGWLRYAQRQGAFSVVERESERLKGVRVDIVYNAKNRFLNAMGKQEVVERRKESLKTTQRIYDLTKARYTEGVTRKSDLLQSEVRVSTAKIELFNAQQEYDKAIEDLRSLLLMQAQEGLTLDGELREPYQTFNLAELVERAARVRPDVTTQTKEVDRLNMVYVERRSSWFPKVDAQLVQTRQDKTLFAENREDTFSINLSYPLFDGVGRYYNMQAAKSDAEAARFRLSETRRNVELEIVKALKDFEQAKQDVRNYRELLRESTSNFDQAYGEYQVGKGDILTVLQAERDLAKAKELLVVALYGANNSLANLERVAYLPGN